MRVFVCVTIIQRVLFFPEEGKSHILQLKLSEVVVMGAVEGSILTIHFSSSLDILQAARNVYGHSKNKVGRGLFIPSLLATISVRILFVNLHQLTTLPIRALWERKAHL